MQHRLSNKGSEWRKWDLHIHTPASFHWNGGKKLIDMNNEEKDAEFDKFIKAINDSDAAVFCLMDYWTFDWYIELQDYLKKNPTVLKKTIFPGIELRIECPVDYRLNIHCILSDKLSKQELCDFKSELHIRSINKKLSNDALMYFAKSLDSSKARVHGFKAPEELNDIELLELGSQTAEISKESLEKACEQVSNMVFILQPFDTSDGLGDLDWETHPHDANYFMQSADIFECRNEKKINLFNGVKTEQNKDYLDNFIKTIGGKAKPCISGSDAHKYSDYGKYPSNRITWIKSEPTFEGLRQIIYEPILRVKIQKEDPNQKIPYEIIDEVRFISNNAIDKNKFTSMPITLNPDLNVIIGGKSSGKSLLLYSIANTLDQKQTQKKEDGKDDKYGFLKEKVDFEVKWSNNDRKILSRNKDQNTSNFPILYLPQSYIQKLADPEGKKTRKEVGKIIRDILLQKEQYRKDYDLFLTEVKRLDASRENLITQFFNALDNYKMANENKKIVGDKDAIIKFIEEKKKQIEDLKKETDITLSEQTEYNIFRGELQKCNNGLFELNGDIEKLNNFNYILNVSINEIITKKKQLLQEIKDDTVKINFTNDFKLLDELERVISIIPSYFIEPDGLISKIRIGIQNNKEIIEEKLKPILTKFANRDEIEKIEQLILKENDKINNINKFEKEIEAKRILKDSIKKDLLDEYRKTHEQYINIVEKLNQRSTEIENLTITGSCRFYTKRFIERFRELINNTTSANILNSNQLFTEEAEINDVLEIDSILNWLSKFFDFILEEKVDLKGRFTKKDAINAIFTDDFFDYWEVKSNKDEIANMSPGKASLVLLKLLIDLSDSKCPILIDQPEDNLDNRSIYSDLVKYIRNKKLDRQFIVVTHNPNIVVGADAENIIVANQNDQDDERKNEMYQFDYINGALENTFAKDENSLDILTCMGIREHVTEILEGGKEAFQKRESKYGYN